MTGSFRIAAQLKPRSSESRIVARDRESGALEVRVKAAPVSNAANEAMIKLISEAFKVPKSKIRIMIGTKSRDKIVEIDADPLDLPRNLKD